MPSSAQLTAAAAASTNPKLYEQKLWEKARYLVAQTPATASSNVTKDGYYNGCRVIPGPQANQQLQPVLKIQDFKIVRHQYYITIVDVTTTQNADHTIGRSLYTVMDDTQADEYEDALTKQRQKRDPSFKPASKKKPTKK